MLIDPFTVIAQIVNFVVLAVALKHFLYDRVIDAMDRREASIAARLRDADERESTARHEAEELRSERAHLEHERHGLLDRARADAAEHRQELLERARAEVEDERRRWHRGLLAEQQEFRRDLQRHTVQEVIELSRRALADLADSRLEAVVLDRALEQLAKDDDARRAVLAIDAAGAPITVRTAFGLSATDRHGVVERLHDLGLERERRVRFEHDPELVLGVELLGGGTAVSWNATDYVHRLAAALDELVERADRADHDD